MPLDGASAPPAPALADGPPVAAGGSPAWIGLAPGAPYFVDEAGAPWTPIGANDSIAWRDLQPLWRRRDPAAVEAHLDGLVASGVTCIRLMLECAQSRHRYFERPAGRFNPLMVQLWDDLFALCERKGLRLLLTPFDTYWTWVRWARHPYAASAGGLLDHPRRLLLDAGVRAAIKARLGFAAERWGGSGALWAWDLWNEIHPAQAEDGAEAFPEFIQDLSDHVRAVERRAHGRAHLQTVSLFGPELQWKPHLELREPIFRHPALDFATIHVYAQRAIDDPSNTVDAAAAMGRIVREALAETPADRPFLDTEHGPIHAFKDKRRTLPAAFDDEMFRHTAWAHLASGGAGGGMRWPNRSPHVLTPGMRQAQGAMSRFLPLIDWARFRRRNLSGELVTAPGRGRLHAFGCGDGDQAVVYLLRRDVIGPDGRLAPDAPPIAPLLRVPGLSAGRWRVTPWDTRTGSPLPPIEAQARDGRTGGALAITLPPFAHDLALAIRRA